MEFVSYEVSDRIAHIQLNRPEKLNTFSNELIRDFKQAIKLAREDDEVRVVILSGKGSSFCAGGDLETMKALPNQTKSYEWMKDATEISLQLRSLPKYVVCAVHGFAAGAGVSLALASDFIVADSQAKFTLSFAKVGLIPDLGLFQLLLERVPVNLLKEWIAFGSVLSSDELFDKGIINQVTEQPVVEAAKEFSQTLVEGSPLSQKYTKEILNQLLEKNLRHSVAAENLYQTLLLQSEDHQEGIQAFFEKRAPVFRGN